MSVRMFISLAGVLGMVGCRVGDGPELLTPDGVSQFDIETQDGRELAMELAMDFMAARPAKAQKGLDFEVRSVDGNPLGIAHVRLQQMQGDVPVFGAEAIVHIRPDGLTSLTDDSLADVSVSTEPLYTAEEAGELALTAHGGFSEAPEIALFVIRHDGVDHLAWQVQLRDIDGATEPTMPMFFIDAHTGEVIWQLEQLTTYSLSDADKTTYDMNNSTNYGSASTGSSTDSELLETHDAVADVLDYFSTQHGRDSYDDAGATVNSYGHYYTNYVNAFWDGSRLTFGDGDGYYSTYLGVSDVVFHEFGHAITDYTANLTYSYESGALNEATSDIFAAAAEAYVDGATSSDTWDIGEDCWIQPGQTALRYMAAPSDDGSSRDHYSDRYTGSGDSGGVHYNSGIANHFFYLLSEGGQHHDSSFRSGYTLTGIGVEDAAAIWYEALTGYMTSSTNFAGARTATESACSALGYGTSTCDAVSYAWYEVGVGSDPGSGGGGGGGGTGTTCSGTSYTGSLSGAGASAIEPGGTYAYFSGGLTADLTGPSSADFDLYLYKWSGRRWRSVDSSTSSSSTESVSSSKSNNYYIEVVSYSGSGSYELCVN
ncbi:MAG: Zn-dependent metalloprotease [Myxococcota bacterium]|jgi:Zn-dependent metalloprotease